MAPGGIRQSRTGKRPIALPKGVSANVKDGAIEVKGPKGVLTRALPPSVSVKVEGGRLSVAPTIDGRDGARFQGLARALFASRHGARVLVLDETEFDDTGMSRLENSVWMQRLDLSHPGKGELVVGPFALGDDGDLVFAGAFERPIIIGGNILDHRQRMVPGIKNAFEQGHAVSTSIFFNF